MKTGRRQRIITGMWAVWVCLTLTGCTAIDGGASGRMPDNPVPAQNGRYAVEINTGFGQPVRWEGAITDGLTVQGALEESGAFRRIRVPEVELVRAVPDQRQNLRMICTMQPGKRRVKYEQDYAILPGDRLIVRPASSEIPLQQVFGGKH